MENNRIVWTPKATPRQNEMGFAVLNIQASYDPNKDLLSTDYAQWYRRGAKLFETRSDCADYIRMTWPNNDPDGLKMLATGLRPGLERFR